MYLPGGDGTTLWGWINPVGLDLPVVMYLPVGLDLPCGDGSTLGYLPVVIYPVGMDLPCGIYLW